MARCGWWEKCLEMTIQHARPKVIQKKAVGLLEAVPNIYELNHATEFVKWLFD